MAGKVGVAPGTTTLNIRPGGSVNLVGVPVNTQQDPGVRIRNAYGQINGLGYFDARPTDFELSKIYGYTPVHRGWITGQVSGACCGPCAVGGTCLGEEEPRERFKMAATVGGAAVGAVVGALALHDRGTAWSAAGAGVLATVLGLIGYKIATSPTP